MWGEEKKGEIEIEEKKRGEPKTRKRLEEKTGVEK